MDGRIILKQILNEGEDWIHLAEDKDQWQAHVNMAMNLKVP
jgi:thiamine phosphate synthase YjbQ (UPF0047 family)